VERAQPPPPLLATLKKEAVDFDPPVLCFAGYFRPQVFFEGRGPREKVCAGPPGPFRGFQRQSAGGGL